MLKLYHFKISRLVSRRNGRGYITKSRSFDIEAPNFFAAYEATQRNHAGWIINCAWLIWPQPEGYPR